MRVAEDLVRRLTNLGLDHPAAVKLVEKLERSGSLEPLERLRSELNRLLRAVDALGEMGCVEAKDWKKEIESLRSTFESILSRIAEGLSRRRGFFGRLSPPSSEIKKARPLIDEVSESIESISSEMRSGASPLIGEWVEKLSSELEALFRSFEEVGASPSQASKLSEAQRILSSLPEDPLRASPLLVESKRLIEEVKEDLRRSEEIKEKLILEFSNLDELVKAVCSRVQELREEGWSPDFVEPVIEWIESRRTRLEQRCAPDDIPCLEMLLREIQRVCDILRNQVLSDLDKMAELAEMVHGALSKVNEASRGAAILDELGGARAFSALVGEIAAELSGMKGRPIPSPREVEELLWRVREFDSLLSDMSAIWEASKEVGESLEAALKKLPEGESAISILRAILSREGDPVEKALEAASTLRDIRELLEGYLEALRDLRKMYPYWRDYVLRLLAEKERISLEDMERIPPGWREWLAERLESEGLVIRTPDGRLRLAGRPVPGPPAPPSKAEAAPLAPPEPREAPLAEEPRPERPPASDLLKEVASAAWWGVEGARRVKVPDSEEEASGLIV
ncbi:MAG: hypothetical protein DRO06_00415 [Thermoproteota archaeon]|nr:MAG: hypothetical protein DRO06_00415 [Candidatus Korarchaeota archaeon]